MLSLFDAAIYDTLISLLPSCAIRSECHCFSTCLYFYAITDALCHLRLDYVIAAMLRLFLLHDIYALCRHVYAAAIFS